MASTMNTTDKAHNARDAHGNTYYSRSVDLMRNYTKRQLHQMHFELFGSWPNDRNTKENLAITIEQGEIKQEATRAAEMAVVHEYEALRESVDQLLVEHLSALANVPASDCEECASLLYLGHYVKLGVHIHDEHNPLSGLAFMTPGQEPPTAPEAVAGEPQALKMETQASIARRLEAEDGQERCRYNYFGLGECGATRAAHENKKNNRDFSHDFVGA